MSHSSGSYAGDIAPRAVAVRLALFATQQWLRRHAANDLAGLCLVDRRQVWCRPAQRIS
jgi:hypothetical protein